MLSGLYGEEQCVRVVEIESSSTLEDFHLAIQGAVGFGNDHLYEFYIAKTERSRDWVRFDEEGGDIYTTTLEDLYPLEKGRKLYYLFDYGDSRLKPHSPKKDIKYPRVIKSVGGNPDQYPDWQE